MKGQVNILSGINIWDSQNAGEAAPRRRKNCWGRAEVGSVSAVWEVRNKRA